MKFFDWFLDFGNAWVVNLGVSIGGENVPLMVILLLGAGAYLKPSLSVR